MQIEINNLTKFKIDKKLFTGVAKKVITGENKEIDLSIAFVSAQEIKKWNKKYRRKNKPTDVLSFNFDNSGEVVICPEIVKQNAQKYDNTYKLEAIKMLVHGILHIAGYDHERSEEEAKEMEEKENFYLHNLRF